MKRIIFAIPFFLAVSLLFAPKISADISADGAIVVDRDSCEVLYGKNADAKKGPASTTKIMTALIALEKGDLDIPLGVDERAVGVEGSSVYLEAGESVTTRDLLYSLLLQSANDAAEEIACRVAGDVPSFVGMMNEKAAELGLCSTHFTNPHGLYDEEHYTTARDLALLTIKAMENDVFRQIVSTVSYTFTTDIKTRTVVNHNKLLRIYKGCVGVKTGYTVKSGRTLVSAAERDGIRLICVTLNAPDDWNDHKKLLDSAFLKAEKEIRR